MTSTLGNCKPQVIYRLTQPTPGMNRRFWNGGDGDAAVHADVGDIFTGPADPVTLFPTHPNPPTIQDVQTDWNFNTADFPSDGTDQMELWGWIVVDEPMLLRDNNGNTGERGETWLGLCCGTPARQPGYNDSTTPVVDTNGADRVLLDPVAVEPGVHFLYVRASDNGAFMGFDLEFSTDNGGSWTNFPAADSFAEKPVVECQAIETCDPIPEGWDLCPPTLCEPVLPPNLGGDGGGLTEAEVQALIDAQDHDDPDPATSVPIADNEVDTNIRSGTTGTSLNYARADHNHPIRRQTNPGDPVLTVAGTFTLLQSIITDRWSTEEWYGYHFRARVQQPAGTGWGWIQIPTIAGFQQPHFTEIGTYRFGSVPVQNDDAAGAGLTGASPRGPQMTREINHWSSTNRLYTGYFRRDNAIDMYVDFNVIYVRN